MSKSRSFHNVSRSFHNVLIVLLVAAVLTFSLPAPVLAQDSIDPSNFKAMKWRLIGPFRGGRVTAVAGHIKQPYTYYFGATGGGVWKTEDGGLNWNNISDGFFNTATIGALAVAPSDENIVYAGTGEAPIRGVSTSHGDGLYKSIDGGKTWNHLGLEDTRHISEIIVHPRNADIVYLAAQGNPWGGSEARGVYKSTDGGKTWNKILFVNSTTGAHSISIDPVHPETVYAGMWDHQRTPWKIRSGGPGSGLWKTTDGGAHWTELKDGLPTLMGNTGITVSPANPNRVWAMIEATEGGIFRSDDAGSSWQRVNSDNGIRDRGWYYTHIFAHPTDENAVYVLAAAMVLSVDGGVTFERVNTRHGDNHDLWINPENPNLMVEGNDGGANATTNAGVSWTTQSNQPTAQFYRVITDNHTPYRLYAGQQDNSTVRIDSSSTSGGIGAANWKAVGGGESASFGFDRDNPRLIYGTSLLGGITEYDDVTGKVRRIDSYPYFSGFRAGRELMYRFNWNAPVLVSQHDPKVIYHGAQLVLKSSDRGLNWKELSPDLTRHKIETLGTTGGPIMIEGAGGEHYATIMYIAESPHDSNVLWTGSDDGLVHVTKDGGQSWQNVTPAGMPEGQVNAIDVSPHDPAVAYIAMTRYKLNDFKPYMYKTGDYGKNWTLITIGIPKDTFARVIREDVRQRGLLFAGTESGPFVSFDDGDHWMALQLNLPTVPITDLRVHGDDLVAATQGRAFWILDGLQPLRQLNDDIGKKDMHLFTPADAVRNNTGRSRGAQGQNPDYGAVIYYTFNEAPKGTVTMRILDEEKNVVNDFSNMASESEKRGTIKGVRREPPAKPLPTEAGQNRYVWNLRTQSTTEVSDTIIYVSTRPYRAVPGNYTVELNADGKTVSQPLRIVSPVSETGWGESASNSWSETQNLLRELTSLVNDIHRSTNQMRSVAGQIRELTLLLQNEDIPSAISIEGEKLIARIQQWEDHIPQSPLPDGRVDRISFPSHLLSTQVFHLMGLVDRGPPTSAAITHQANVLQDEWGDLVTAKNELLANDLQKFNELLLDEGEGLKPITVPEGNVTAARL